MLEKLKEEVKLCKDIADELDAALRSTMLSSIDFNREINAARARMKVCLDEMKKGIPPRERTIHN